MATAAESTSTSQIGFDPDGDIVLVLQATENRDVQFRICSRILSLVSPVFKAMFDPSSRFIEGTAIRNATAASNSLPVKIKLGGDDPDAMMHLLAMVHHYHLGSLMGLPLDMLLHLATLCDKYDICSRIKKLLCREYCPSWNLHDAAGWSNRLWKGTERTKDLGKRLNVCYIFNFRHLFPEVCKQIILAAVLDESGNFVVDGVSIGAHIPAKIEDALKAARAAILMCLLKKLQSQYQRYLPITQTGTGTPVCKKRNPSCDAVILGGIISLHAKFGFYPSYSLQALNEKSLGSIQERLYSNPTVLPFYAEERGGCCHNPTHPSNGLSWPIPVCHSCNKPLTIPKVVSHKTTCSPVKAFGEELEAIIKGMTTLQLGDYLAKTGNIPASLGKVLGDSGVRVWDAGTGRFYNL